MPVPRDATPFGGSRRRLLLTLAAGPLLGAVIFFAMAGRDGSPSPVPEAGHIQVPWHKSTRLTALEVTRTGLDTVDVLTRRDSKSGTSYALRRIDCAAREFQYLGEGATEQQAKAGRASDLKKNRLTDGTISFYVAAHVCPDGKTK
jgi:hypothetical protein